MYTRKYLSFMQRKYHPDRTSCDDIDELMQRFLNPNQPDTRLPLQGEGPERRADRRGRRRHGRRDARLASRDCELPYVIDVPYVTLLYPDTGALIDTVYLQNTVTPSGYGGYV